MVKVVFRYFCEVLVYPKRIYYIDYILLYFVTYAALAQILYCKKLHILWGKISHPQILFEQKYDNYKVCIAY